MKLIVNADDFGYSTGVNLGIIEAYQTGIVTSTTMMVNMHALDHAVSLAQRNPGLGVGIHLALTCGSPVRDDVPSLVDGQGRFRMQCDIFQHADAQEIERELESQIERFYAIGLTPTHLDSHHHVHSHPLVLPIVLRLAERYQLPIRRLSNEPNMADLYGRIKTTAQFYWDFYGDQVSYETMVNLIQLGIDKETVEIMCHPAYVDAPLLEGSSYALPRVKELAILTDDRIKQVIKQSNIALSNFRAVS